MLAAIVSKTYWKFPREMLLLVELIVYENTGRVEESLIILLGNPN